MLFLIVTLIIATAISPRYFLTRANIVAILISSSPLIVLTVGQAIVILIGSIDLGAEATLASSTVIVAYLSLYTNLPVAVCMIATMAYGISIGFINGLLVTKARIPSFIVTLGMYWGLRGVGILIEPGGEPMYPSVLTPPKPFGFESMASQPYGIPILVIIAVVITIVFQVLLSRFRLGKHIYAVGGNENAARNTGVNADRTKIMAFVLMGALSAFAGLMFAAWLDLGYAWNAQGYSLQSVAGTVLGGVSFTGGTGTVVGAFIGAFVLGIINDMIVLLGISPNWSYVVIAIVLVLAGLQLRAKGWVK